MYVIIHYKTKLFWSNTHGWGSLEGATRFSRKEQATLRLPLDGMWVLYEYVAKTEVKNKNEQLLASFVRYCKENPELRFWQALRNWSGFGFIWVSDNTPEQPDFTMIDTFHFEGKMK